MRNIPASFTGGAMTLARCWRLTRKDGVVLGFTDHDRDILFDGVTYAAGTGLEAADMQAELGFAITGGEASGALSSPGITEADIANGRYDGAKIDLFLVDWNRVDQRILMESGAIGEIRRMGKAFAAEIRSLTFQLDEERGRLFRLGCSADLGDAQCGIALDSSVWRYDGSVVATDGRVSVAVSQVFERDFFTGGSLLLTSGANVGTRVEIQAQAGTTTSTVLTLWQAMALPIQIGDAVSLRAGCDKSFKSCRDRFQNAINFRGFPHMPGNDFVILSVSDGAPGMDGGLVRGVWRALYGAEPEEPGPYQPGWVEPPGEERLRDAGRRHLREIALTECQAGDVLMFRWRDHLPAKHIGIATSKTTMIHAHEGAVVAEIALAPWRSRLCYAFRFPDLPNEDA